MNDTPTGRFCWYELMTTDPEGAAGFYQEVTGWGTQPWEGGDQPYTMWMKGETPLGGLMALPEEAQAQGAPPHWLAYISTADVTATTARARELGANVLVDGMKLPEVGTISVIADPQGAVFCAFQPATYTPGHDDAPAPGDVSWHELATTDWEAAWAFYSDLFDWQVADSMDMGDMGVYHMFHRGAHPLGGMFNRPPEMPVSAWLLYVMVEDLDAAVEAVRSGGGQVLNGPMEVPGGGRVAQCMDAQGAAFALHQDG